MDVLFFYQIDLLFIFAHAKNVDLPLKTTNICKSFNERQFD